MALLIEQRVENLEHSLDVMNSQVRSDISDILDQLSHMKTNMDCQGRRLRNLESDVATLKSDVATLKSDVATLKNQMELVLNILESIQGKLNE